MTSVHYILLSEIDEAKCGACGRLVRQMGPYCSEMRQRLDMTDKTAFSQILLHCGGPYSYPKKPEDNAQSDSSHA